MIIRIVDIFRKRPGDIHLYRRGTVKPETLTKNQRIIISILLAAVLIIVSVGFAFKSSLLPSINQFPNSTTPSVPSPLDGRILRVGGDADYPPFSFLENGEAKGFDNDLIRAVAEVMGAEVEFYLTPWEDAKQNLLSGKVDVIGGMAYSEDREPLFEFGTPHSALYFDLFIRRNSSIKKIEDIQGKRIIIQRGGVMEDYLKETGFTGEVIRVENPLEALRLLAAGQYDGALLNKIQGYYFIKENQISNLKSLGEFINERQYGFAVAESNRVLLQELNQALAIIDTNGVNNQIHKKWFSVYEQESFFDQARYYIFGAVVLAVLSLMAVAWVWSLRRIVKRRTSEAKSSEKKYRSLIQNATEGVVVVVDGNLAYFNPRALEILGIMDEGDHAPTVLRDIVHPDDLELVRENFTTTMEKGENSPDIMVRILHSDGESRWVIANLVRSEWEKQPAIICFFSDITGQREVEEKIRLSEERYRLLFTKSPVGLFYYDTSLKITNSNEIVNRIMRTNREVLEGYDLNQLSDSRVLPAIRAILDHEEGYYEGPFTPIGELVKTPLYIALHTTPIFNEKFEYKGGIALIEDITEKVKSEHKIQKLEERFKKVFYTSPDAINLNRLSDGLYVDVNRSFVELTGFTREEIMGKTSIDLDIWANPGDRARLVGELRTKGEVKNFEADFRMKDGRILSGLMSASIIEVDDIPCILSITRDITEIKKTQNAIRDSELRYRSIFETVPISLWEQDFLAVYDMLEDLRSRGITDLSGYLEEHPEFLKDAIETVVVLDVNDESMEIYKAKSKAELFSSIATMFADESYQSFKDELLAIWEKKTIYNGETINKTLTGELINVNVLYRIPENREDFAHILVSISDITARKQAEEQVKRQVQHLAALRAVDLAISASMDLPVVLRVLLNQVQQQLKVHSASILLLNPQTQKLNYAAGAGFKSRAVENTDLKLGESYAGKAALERRIIAANDLGTRFSQLATDGMEEDGFTDYMGIPLIAKGAVKGVLEIFNRGPLPEDSQWLNLLDSMASQAAIAIDNATLFEDVQTANESLRQAYDATIEGWARALELRDGDTEGHSSRVATLAVQLARLVGMKEPELIALRRGALLHDIGKMGIPDTILLKSTDLTDKEWQIMRMHPILGKNMLSSIEFLKDSLDVAYCHHEKWDGTGYPEGLKGEQIPLAARIFSVIDGWDALRSDRPYRVAVSDEEAWKYIEENIGKAYDPRIVEKFKIMMKGQLSGGGEDLVS